MLARTLIQAFKTPTFPRFLSQSSAHFFSTTISESLPTFSKETNRLFPAPNRWQLIFDGGCPACTATALRLKMDDMDLINVREGTHPIIKTLETHGHNFDKYMGLVSPEGKVFIGKDALREVAKRRGGFFKIASPLVDVIYPGLVSIRNAIVNEPIATVRARQAAEAQSAAEEASTTRPQ